MNARSLILFALTAASTSTAVCAGGRPPVHASTPMSYTGRQANTLASYASLARIGSTVDPFNGDQNPYGLTIAPASGGKIAAGDLVVCNFNDALNIQGLGTTIEILKPVIGAKPSRLIADARLTGCAAIAMGGAAPWVAALDANDNPIVTPGGQLLTALSAYPWQGAWGQAFAAGPHTTAAFYESNANDGSIVRIDLTTPFTFEKIASGFSVNHGVPGSILAPSGLTYDPVRDVLYIVDGDADRVVEIHAPGSVHAGGITVVPGGFSGPSARSAEVLYAGNPLDAPISAALLFNGDLDVGNTGNNDLVELSPAHTVTGQRTVDFGKAGAIFGIAAGGTSLATTRIYFNDDNDNAVKMLAH